MISEKSNSRNEESNTKQLTLDEAVQSEGEVGDESGIETNVFVEGMIRLGVILLVIVGIVMIPVAGVSIVDIIVSIAVGAIMELLGINEVIGRFE